MIYGLHSLFYKQLKKSRLSDRFGLYLRTSFEAEAEAEAEKVKTRRRYPEGAQTME